MRAECLDLLLISGRGHLEQVLRVYVAHYNHHHPHRALGLEPPDPLANLRVVRDSHQEGCIDVTCSADSSTNTVDELHERVSAPNGLRGLQLDPGSGRMVPRTRVGRSARRAAAPPGEGAAAPADHCGHQSIRAPRLGPRGRRVLPAGLVNACRTDPFAWLAMAGRSHQRTADHLTGGPPHDLSSARPG